MKEGYALVFTVWLLQVVERNEMLQSELHVLLGLTDDLEARIEAADEEYQHVCLALATEKQRTQEVHENLLASYAGRHADRRPHVEASHSRQLRSLASRERHIEKLSSIDDDEWLSSIERPRTQSYELHGNVSAVSLAHHRSDRSASRNADRSRRHGQTHAPNQLPTGNFMLGVYDKRNKHRSRDHIS